MTEAAQVKVRKRKKFLFRDSCTKELHFRKIAAELRYMDGVVATVSEETLFVLEVGGTVRQVEEYELDGLDFWNWPF